MFVRRKILQKCFSDYYNNYGKETSFVNVAKKIYLQKAYVSKAWDSGFIPGIVPMEDTAFLALADETPIDIRNAAMLEYSRQDLAEEEEDNIIPKTSDLFAYMNFDHFGGNLRNQKYLEINYIYRGSCKLQYADKIIPLTEGDFIIVGPNCIRNHIDFENLRMITISIRNSAFRNAFFSLISEHSLLSEFLLQCLFGNKPDCLLFPMKGDTITRAVMQNIYLESNYQNKIGYNSCAVGWMNILLSHVLRTAQKDNLSYTPKVDIAFYNILNYIESNYKTLTLSKLAGEFHFSSTYMSHYIQNHFGRSYLSLVQELKLGEAKRLLAESNLSVEEIAVQAGYHSGDHFTRMFKKNYRITPQAFRRNERKFS